MLVASVISYLKDIDADCKLNSNNLLTSKIIEDDEKIKSKFRSRRRKRTLITPYRAHTFTKTLANI